MLQSIVVPLDGSALAAHALPWAVRLARAAHGRLELVWVGEEQRPGAPDERADEAERELGTLVARLRDEGLTVAGHVTRDDAAHAVLEAARGSPAGLIVMSTHGRAGLGRRVYGRVADRVLRATSAPVLLVPATGDGEWAAAGPPVVVVLDGSALAEAALEPAAELAAGLATRLVLCGISRPGEGSDPEPGRLVLASYLESVAGRLRDQGQAVTTRLATGSPTAALAHLGGEPGGALLAMITRGPSGSPALALGHVTTGALGRAHLPVLLVPPGQAREGLPDGDWYERLAAGPPRRVTLSLPELSLVQRGLVSLLQAAEVDTSGWPASAGDDVRAKAVTRVLAQVNRAVPNLPARAS